MRYQGVRSETGSVQLGDAIGKSTQVVFAWSIRDGDVENTYEVDARCKYVLQKGVPVQNNAPPFSKQVIQAMASSATAAAAGNQHVVDAGATLICKYQALRLLAAPAPEHQLYY